MRRREGSWLLGSDEQGKPGDPRDQRAEYYLAESAEARIAKQVQDGDGRHSAGDSKEQ